MGTGMDPIAVDERQARPDSGEVRRVAQLVVEHVHQVVGRRHAHRHADIAGYAYRQAEGAGVLFGPVFDIDWNAAQVEAKPRELAQGQLYRALRAE